ncbi:MAG: hypothetical protein HRU26_13755 [Psychroserpens sp.]|nr:hypothetical protein [Psychroserpens sp.]
MTTESLKEELLFDDYIMEDENGNLLIMEKGPEFNNNDRYTGLESNQTHRTDLNANLKKVNRKYIRNETQVVAFIIFIQMIMIGIFIENFTSDLL